MNIWHDIKKELPEEGLKVALLDKNDSIFYGVANRNGVMNQSYPVRIDFWAYEEDYEKILPQPNWSKVEQLTAELDSIKAVKEGN